MQLAPAHLIALLRDRGVRVEVEELLRLHEALQAGADWTPQRLENVIVGILATCPEDPATIREAIRGLRRALEPTLAPGRPAGPPPRRVTGPPPLVSRRLVVALGLGGVATAAAAVTLVSPRAPPAVTPAPDPAAATPEPAVTSEPAATPDPPAPDPPAPAVPAPEEREEPAPELADPATPPVAAVGAEPTPGAETEPSWTRLLGAGLLGPAAAAGAIAWFAHRAWRRRLREVRRFGGPALEVAPGPSLFWLAARDRRWPPLLGAEAREALVWGVGQAASEEPTRVLDEDATIAATVDHGGLPDLRWRGRRSLRRVWLWHDQSAAGPLGAPLCAEVQQTLHGYGLAVEVGRFWGLPERLERDDGCLLPLDALEEERELSTVIILTDGGELLRQWRGKDAQGRSRQPRVRALLRRLAGWAHLTVVHTGGREGLRALRALLDPLGIPCVPLEALPLAVRERDHLARTVGTVAAADHVWIWAALCALYPLPVPEGLALALLRHLDLPISPLSLGQLLDQSVTTGAIQFKPAVRARLIERLRRALDDGSGALPRAMKQALAFWRARTIADDPGWASDTTGRGLHRRLVVALLDVWTAPERAAQELSALWKSPHMPAVREELARMRPTAGRADAPEPGTFHVPIDPSALSPTARARLRAAGMGWLAAPGRDGSRRDRWPWSLRALVASAALLFMGAALAILAGDRLWSALSGEPACAAEPPSLAATWNDDARAALRRSFAATATSWAEDAGRRTIGALDVWATAWERARIESCEARRSVSDVLVTARESACLEQRRLELEALLELLVRADAEVVQNAVAMVGKLDDPPGCLDDGARPLPAPPSEQRDAVLELGRALDGVEASVRAARHSEALSALTKFEDRVVKTGYEPLLVRLLVLRGRASLASEDATGGVAALERAADLAEGSGDDRELATVWRLLARWALVEAGDEARGLSWLRRAEASARRLGVDPARSGELAFLRGSHQLLRADLGLAEQEFRVAIADFEARARTLDLVEARRSLGSTLLRSGQLESAVKVLQDARAGAEAVLGPHHPIYAAIARDLGSTLLALGRTEEAQAELRTAVSVWTGSAGEPRPELGNTYIEIASLELAAGRQAEAGAELDRAEAILRATRPARHSDLGDLASARAAVAFAGGDFPAASQALDQVIEIYREALGPDDPYLAKVTAERGWVAIALGRIADAERDFTAADVALRDGELAALRQSSLRGLAVVSGSRGGHRAALAWLEQIDVAACSPEERANYHLWSAVLHWRLGDAARARQHFAAGRAAVTEATRTGEIAAMNVTPAELAAIEGSGAG